MQNMVSFTKRREKIRNIRKKNSETNIWANQRECTWRCRHNTKLYELYKDIGIVNDIKVRLQWEGHMIRMPEERIPWKVMMGRLEGVRPIGRPSK
jgi:hypothetical protein